MSLLCWNCRGVGNPQVVQQLDGLVRSHNPKLIFLSETRMIVVGTKNLRWKLRLRNCLVVDSNGLSGGIALFGDESIRVSLHSMSDRFIDVIIQETPETTPWRSTFTYGELRVENRPRMWEAIRRLCGVTENPMDVNREF